MSFTATAGAYMLYIPLIVQCIYLAVGDLSLNGVAHDIKPCISKLFSTQIYVQEISCKARL